MKAAYQNMISANSPSEVLNNHSYNLRFYNAADSDCWISSLEEIPSYDPAFAQGFRSRFQLHFSNHLGWKVYMLCTGVMA